MEGFLEFINANYIWLIIVAAVILFALIGYIADKHGFNNTKKVKKEEINPVENNNKEIKEKNDKSIKKEKMDTVELIEDINPEEELEQIEEVLMEEINVDEEQLELTKTNEKQSSYNEDLNIDQDFNKLLEDVEETTNEANIQIPEDTPIEIEEEDIWKF